jgi:hypothetical protein
MSKDTPEVDATSMDADNTAEAETPLGPEGERALAIWKNRAKEAEMAAKRADELEARLAEIEAANMSDQERAIEQARKEAADTTRAEVLKVAHRKLFSAEVKAAATGKVATPELFSKPEVALGLLGFDDYPLNSDGDIDTEAISVAVERFADSHSALKASATPAPTPIAQGPRGRPGPDPERAMDDWLRAQRSAKTR